MPLFGDNKREYQRNWKAQRRLDGLAYLGGKCVVCGTTKNLNVDHKDPKKKVDHKIWSWAWDRVTKELDKCQLLCETHHQAKTKSNAEASRGTALVQAKLNDDSVRDIRRLYALGTHSYGELAKQFGVDKSQIARVVKRKTWDHIK